MRQKISHDKNIAVRSSIKNENFLFPVGTLNFSFIGLYSELFGAREPVCTYITLLYHIMHIIYHIIPYHMISYHIMSCFVMSYHIISYHISYHIISYHIISSYRIVSYHIISISYHIISCYIILLWKLFSSGFFLIRLLYDSLFIYLFIHFLFKEIDS